MKKYLFLLLCFLSVGIAFAQKDSTLQKNYSDFVILPSTKVTLASIGRSDSHVWTVDSATVKTVFTKLPYGIDSINGKSPSGAYPDNIPYDQSRQLMKLSAYNYQILSFKNKDGHHILYFNALCDNITSTPAWKTLIYVVDDGGVCYYQIFYDLDTGLWGPLMVNGFG